MQEFSQTERRSAPVHATRWSNILQWLKRIGAGIGIAAALAPAEALPA